MESPSENKPKPKQRARVHINYSWCKKCRICIVYCPTGVFTSDQFNSPIISFPEKCINCGLCVLRCPDFAVKLEPLEPEKNAEHEASDKIESGPAQAKETGE